jgi:putative acetyltransferase
MRTVRAHLRKGIASQMLRHIIGEGRRRAYRRLSIETGSQPAFDPARALYLRFGFEYCGPFSDYTDDPNSVYMSLEL